MEDTIERRQYKTPSVVISKNIELLTNRELVGLQKYGHTLDRKDLTHRELLQHGLEEALDLANYLQASMQMDLVYERAYKDLRERIEKMIAEEGLNGIRSSTDVTKKLITALNDHKFRYPTA